MVTEYFLKRLTGLSEETGKSLEELTAEYKSEYEKILANVQVKLGHPIYNLLKNGHSEQYFHLCKRIGDVALDKVRQNYIDDGWTSCAKKHINK